MGNRRASSGVEFRATTDHLLLCQWVSEGETVPIFGMQWESLRVVCVKEERDGESVHAWDCSLPDLAATDGSRHVVSTFVGLPLYGGIDPKTLKRVVMIPHAWVQGVVQQLHSQRKAFVESKGAVIQ